MGFLEVSKREVDNWKLGKKRKEEELNLLQAELKKAQEDFKKLNDEYVRNSLDEDVFNNKRAKKKELLDLENEIKETKNELSQLSNSFYFEYDKNMIEEEFRQYVDATGVRENHLELVRDLKKLIDRAKEIKNTKHKDIFNHFVKYADAIEHCKIMKGEFDRMENDRDINVTKYSVRLICENVTNEINYLIDDMKNAYYKMPSTYREKIDHEI